MKISYDKLWKLLIDKKINKTQLKEMANITSNCMAKMGRDEPVHLEVIIRICEVLECNINDILESFNEEV